VIQLQKVLTISDLFWSMPQCLYKLL